MKSKTLLLLLIIAFTFFGCSASPGKNYGETAAIKSQTTKSTTTKSPTNNGPILKGLGVNFETDFAFDKGVIFKDRYIQNKKVLLEFGSSEHSIKNPQQNVEYWYFLKPKTKISAIVEGVVSISFIEHTKDWAVHIRQKNDWTVSFEHLKKLSVKNGEVVKVGDILGEAVPWSANKNIGFTELAVWKGGVAGIYKYCPFDFLDEKLKPTYSKKINKLASDWEEFIGQDVYKEDKWISPGCIVDKIKEK